MRALTFDEVKEVTKEHHHVWWEGVYNIFLYGIRSRGLEVDMWNDVLGVCYIDGFGNKINLMHSATTKPGLYWLKKKMGNINGTAILIPGQYRGCWKVGEHKGYTALVQRGSIFDVWRDGDADGQFDYNGKVYHDVTGLNMHTESDQRVTEKVGAYSAGCQVREFDKEHFAVMGLIEHSLSRYENSFSFTLFEDRDFYQY